MLWMRGAIKVGLLTFLGVTECGCHQHFNPMRLDWGDRSFHKKVRLGERRGDSWKNLTFALTVDAHGLGKDGVHKSYSIMKEGLPCTVRVTFGWDSTPRHGASAAVIRLSSSVGGFLSQPPRLEAKAEDIALRDNKGHKFTVRRIRPFRAGDVEFLVNSRQDDKWMEFNNKDYYLSLTVRFKYGGQDFSASWPKILCVVGNPPKVGLM